MVSEMNLIIGHPGGVWDNCLMPGKNPTHQVSEVLSVAAGWQRKKIIQKYRFSKRSPHEILPPQILCISVRTSVLYKDFFLPSPPRTNFHLLRVTSYPSGYIVSSKVSQPQDCWHSGLEDPMLCRAGICIIGCLAQSLACTPWSQQHHCAKVRLKSPEKSFWPLKHTVKLQQLLLLLLFTHA